MTRKQYEKEKLLLLHSTNNNIAEEYVDLMFSGQCDLSEFLNNAIEFHNEYISPNYDIQMVKWDIGDNQLSMWIENYKYETFDDYKKRKEAYNKKLIEDKSKIKTKVSNAIKESMKKLSKEDIKDVLKEFI